MKFDLKMTASFTEDDVKDLITQELNRQGYEVTNVSIVIGTRTEGMQWDTYKVQYLKEINAKVIKKRSNSYMDR